MTDTSRKCECESLIPHSHDPSKGCDSTNTQPVELIYGTFHLCPSCTAHYIEGGWLKVTRYDLWACRAVGAAPIAHGISVDEVAGILKFHYGPDVVAYELRPVKE